MKALAFAPVLALAIAAPAQASWDYTLPGGYRSLVLKAPNSAPIEARGAYVPVLWFGGPTRFFTLRVEGGGLYQTDAQGGVYSYALGQAIMNFELPLGPITPYLGVVGHVAYPFQQPGYVSGSPYGVMPQAGLGVDLGILELDLHAAQGPVWGLSRSNGVPYEAMSTELGGRASFSF